PLFSRIHPRFKTPYVSTLITGFIALILAGILPINILGELVSIGTLLAFAIVCIGIIILRYKRPDIKRAFKTPFVPFVPIMGAGICFAQMFSLPWETWARLIAWMALGFVIYFTYGIHKSKLHN
ncbi:MAG: amino acid permease, partial [Verrucomicrobia bacterium]|nr:amino acid permease [Prolixibacteraceae bacterium]